MFSGRDLTVQFDSQTAVGSLTPLTKGKGVQSVTGTHGKAEVDITSADDDGWRTLLVQPGMRNLDASFSGVMLAANYNDLLDRWHDDRYMLVTIRHPTGYHEGGDCFIQSLETTGEHAGAVTFSAALLFTGRPLRVLGDMFLGAVNTFYSLDPFTAGAARVHATNNVTFTDANLSSFRGLVYRKSNDTFYANLGNRLCTINPATGVATQVGSATNWGIASLTATYTLAYDNDASPGHAWLVGNTDWLVRVNLATGVGTRQGAATNWGVSETDMRALFFHKGQCYGWGFARDRLYTINITDGTATDVAGTEALRARGRSKEYAHGVGGFQNRDPVDWDSNGVSVYCTDDQNRLFEFDAFSSDRLIVRNIKSTSGFGASVTGARPFITTKQV